MQREGKCKPVFFLACVFDFNILGVCGGCGCGKGAWGAVQYRGAAWNIDVCVCECKIFSCGCVDEARDVVDLWILNLGLVLIGQVCEYYPYPRIKARFCFGLLNSIRDSGFKIRGGMTPSFSLVLSCPGLEFRVSQIGKFDYGVVLTATKYIQTVFIHGRGNRKGTDTDCHCPFSRSSPSPTPKHQHNNNKPPPAPITPPPRGKPKKSRLKSHPNTSQPVFTLQAHHARLFVAKFVIVRH